MTWLLAALPLGLVGWLAAVIGTRRQEAPSSLPPEQAEPFTPDRVTERQRRAIDSIRVVVDSALDRGRSDDLLPRIPGIVLTCRSLVLDDPRSIRFVEELHGTATCAAFEERASCDAPWGEQGWGQLVQRLEDAFPGVRRVGTEG